MASEDIHIVPPVGNTEEELETFYNQICEVINGTTNVAGNIGDGLGGSGDIPPDVTGLIASGGYGTNTILWNTVEYPGHSEVVLFRATDGNVNNAIPVGSTAADSFSDPISNPEAMVTYTYWAKNINVFGTMSTNYSNPASCILSVDVNYAIDVLLGKLGYNEFQDGNFPVRTVDVLPNLPDQEWPIGCVAFLTTNSKMYTNKSNVWSSTIASDDVIGLGELAGLDSIFLNKVLDSGTLAALDDIDLSLVTDAGNLAELDTVSSTEIDDNSITTPKIVTNAIISEKIIAGAVVADKIGANAVTASKILAGSIESDKLAVNSVIAGKIAAGALVVDDGVMNNGYIKTALIGNGQITNAKIVNLAADKITGGIINATIALNAATINSGDINGGTIDGTTITGTTIQTTTDASTNGGVVLTGKTMSVYDTSGQVRVKLGLL